MRVRFVQNLVGEHVSNTHLAKKNRHLKGVLIFFQSSTVLQALKINIGLLKGRKKCYHTLLQLAFCTKLFFHVSFIILSCFKDYFGSSTL